MQENHSDFSRVAQNTLVLGSSGLIQPDPPGPAQSVQPANTAFQSDFSQESGKPKYIYLAPRASTIKEQGFSDAVAARIEALQRGSTRSVYEANWCLSDQVDFRAPPIKSIADFLLYLFQDRKLLPITIQSYRSAIADILEICLSMSAKMKISLVSWIISTETDPRFRGAFPPGTFPWYFTSSQRLLLNPLKRPH